MRRPLLDPLRLVSRRGTRSSAGKHMSTVLVVAPLHLRAVVAACVYAGINNDPSFSTGIHIADTGIPRGAFLIVACDGIWDAISSEEAVKFVAEDTGE